MLPLCFGYLSRHPTVSKAHVQARLPLRTEAAQRILHAEKHEQGSNEDIVYFSVALVAQTLRSLRLILAPAAACKCCLVTEREPRYFTWATISASSCWIRLISGPLRASILFSCSMRGMILAV
jgi:hypothetical protein